MNPTKIAMAVAAVAAAFGGGSALAGSFQTNSTTIAREVIVSDAQQIVAPQVSYSFSGPVRNPSNETYFQIQLKLDSGIWSVPTGASFPTNSNPGAGNGNVALVSSTGLVIATANAVRIDDQTIKATFRLPAGPGENNARVVFNAAGQHAAAGAAPTTSPVQPVPSETLRISGLKSVVGDIVDCDVALKKITGSITQYPDITDPGYTATSADDSPASEHKYPGAQNNGPVASFPTNLKVSGVSTTDISVQDYSAQGKKFKYIDATSTPNVTASGKTVRLGTVRYDQLAQGYDADLATVYGSLTPTANVVTQSVSNAGPVELKAFSVSLSGSFASSARVWLVPDTVGSNACTDPGYATSNSVLSGDSLNVSYDYTTSPINKNTNFAVCYGVDGNQVIPTTAISAKLTLNKALDGKSASDTIRFQEQNNSCTAQFNVGGGIRIDIRNYASYAKFGNSGTSSVVRVINNSETATADLYAQMIYADGSYGAWGRLPDLAPRAVANYSNKELEAYMTNAAASANPFGSAATNYKQTGGSSVVGSNALGVGDRVRFVSTTGSTLRVQSYISSGSVMIDTSGAQGVDFEGLAAPSNGRAPTTDAQPNSQDAINGLSRGQ